MGQRGERADDHDNAFWGSEDGVCVVRAPGVANDGAHGRRRNTPDYSREAQCRATPNALAGDRQASPFAESRLVSVHADGASRRQLVWHRRRVRTVRSFLPTPNVLGR